MDKQIIIDGVDVSGCEWYKQGATDFICADYNKSNDCSKNPNCYYKQLKCKEQECEEWKYANDCILTTLNVIAEGNKKLRQTLTEIKEIAETQRRYIDDIKGFMFDDKLVEWKSAYIDFSTACRRLNQEILQKIGECEE